MSAHGLLVGVIVIVVGNALASLRRVAPSATD